jgi:hypothetical protein
MLDENHPKHQIDDELDRALRTALTKYALVEPRPGLEERILAHIRVTAVRAERALWGIAVAAAMAVAGVAIASVLLASRIQQLSPPQMANHRVVRPGIAPQPPSQISSAAGSEMKFAPTRRLRPKEHSIVVVPQPTVGPAGNPRLDQFPSPRPLTEQEKLLAGYVVDHPEQAVLLARARSEALQRDLQLMPETDEAIDQDPEHFKY